MKIVKKVQDSMNLIQVKSLKIIGITKKRKEEELMDIVTKIVSVIGGIVGVLAALGIITGVKDVRSGMATDDPRKTDKGIESIIVGGVFAAIVTAVVAYVLAQLGAIKF